MLQCIYDLYESLILKDMVMHQSKAHSHGDQGVLKAMLWPKNLQNAVRSKAELSPGNKRISAPIETKCLENY